MLDEHVDGRAQPPAPDLVAALLRVVEPALHRRRADGRATAPGTPPRLPGGRGGQARAGGRAAGARTSSPASPRSPSTWSSSCRRRASGASEAARAASAGDPLGPVPIVNIRYSARADRLLGYRSETLVYDVYRITTASQFDHVLEPLAAHPGRPRQLVPYAAFLWAGLRFDVFGFFFDGGLLGETPFWRLELRLLRLAGKKIVVYPYGGDARLASRDARARPAGTRTATSRRAPRIATRPTSRSASTRSAAGRTSCSAAPTSSRTCRASTASSRTRSTRRAGRRSPERRRRRRHDRARAEPPALQGHAVPRATRSPGLRPKGLPVELVLVEGVPERRGASDLRARRHRRRPVLIGAYALFAIEGDGARQARASATCRSACARSIPSGRTRRSSARTRTRSPTSSAASSLDADSAASSAPGARATSGASTGSTRSAR